jgi:predicted lactoylglutathione lyase
MNRMIFVNLPVTDLERSKAFYEAIGAANEPRFTDETAAMMRFSDEINVMIMTHDKFRGFSPRAIPNPRETAQVLLCLSAGSRDAVDAMLADVERAGGVIDPTQLDDYGFMYGRSFEDPDGHLWEVMWMDPAAAEQGAASFEEA